MKNPIAPVLFALFLTACSPSRSTEVGSGDTATNSAPALAVTNSIPASTNLVLVPKIPEDLPLAARELITLAHGQLGDGILTNYIGTLQEPFQLNAEQIVYLKDIGLSSAVIECLLVRQQQLGPVPEEPAPAIADSNGKNTSPVVSSPFNAPAVPATPSPGPGSSTTYPGGESTPAAPQVGPAQPVAASTEVPPTVTNYNFFYDSLAPYGNWITVPTYGYVWQPSCAVVTPGWRPYWNNGSWAWTDCGWYWNSSYSWGWAPFHYGNWCNAPGYGWCWVPGNVWGPSWVTFRYSSGYCGWAPLPPGCGWQTGVGLTFAGGGVGLSFGFGYGAGNYCWTPTSYFAAPNCASYGVVGAAGSQYYKNSSVINNYVVGNNNTIINGGIDPGQIQKHSRSEVRKVSLADVSSPSASRSSLATARPGQATQLAVYRPTVNSAAPAPSTLRSGREETRSSRVVSPSSSGGSGYRTSLPQRPAAAGIPPSSPTRTPARIDLPAGSSNPLGSSTQLHSPSRSSAVSPGTSGQRMQGSARPSPVVTPATPPVSTVTGRPTSARVPVQAQGQQLSPNGQAPKLEPRKQTFVDNPSTVNNTPGTPFRYARPQTPAVQNPRFADANQGPARIPPTTQNSFSARPQFNGTAGAAPGRINAPAMVPQQAPRQSFSAPVTAPSAVSRPQYPAGGSGVSSSGRPGRQAP